MPGLAPGIHVLLGASEEAKTWMAGTSPAMTLKGAFKQAIITP
jgi:hypothetical protein